MKGKISYFLIIVFLTSLAPILSQAQTGPTIVTFDDGSYRCLIGTQNQLLKRKKKKILNFTKEISKQQKKLRRVTKTIAKQNARKKPNPKKLAKLESRLANLTNLVSQIENCRDQHGLYVPITLVNRPNPSIPTTRPPWTGAHRPSSPDYGGVDYYVATTGDDSNPGTLDAPFQTIQHAADIVMPGDTVFVRGGIYTRDTSRASYPYTAVLEIYRYGTDAQPITFKNYQNEIAILDASVGGQTYAIEIGEQRWDRNISAQNITIDGLVATGAYRNGIFMLDPHNLIIQNCEVFANDRGAIQNGAGFEAGIHAAGGESTTIFNNRSYFNGIGIWLYELDSAGGLAPGHDDKKGSRNFLVKDNFVFANSNSANFGNSPGIAVRFVEDSLIQGNLIWNNPDGCISGEGNINNRVIGNACLHHWQDPARQGLNLEAGNREGIKIGVRGGGGNLFANNISAFNGQRGWDTADGIGEVWLNNVTYGNKEWGMLLEGRASIVLNSISYLNQVGELHPHRDIVYFNGTLHPNSDYNWFGEEIRLPQLWNWDDTSFLTANHSRSGSPLFVNPEMQFPENDVYQVTYPEEIFTDYDQDGIVTIAEARKDIAAHFALAAVSGARNAGMTLQAASIQVKSAIPAIIAAINTRINDWNGDGVWQHLEGTLMFKKLIANLQSNGSHGYGDFSDLTDFAGNPISTNAPVHMGAVQ